MFYFKHNLLFFNDFPNSLIVSTSPLATAGEDGEPRVVLTTIPVAPPANLINPDKPVAMATVPAHISTASASTKQKLLQAIQMKEQQRFLEQTIAQQLGQSLGQSPEFLAQALKNMIPVGSLLSHPLYTSLCHGSIYTYLGLR